MKNKAIFIGCFVILIFFVGFVSAVCTGNKPNDFCFGTKVYSYKCNGTDWDDSEKGDCAISGMTCKDAECVDKSGCETNLDCDDDNPCTMDFCMGDTIKRCDIIPKDGCVFGDKCVPINVKVMDNGLAKMCNINGNLESIDYVDKDYNKSSRGTLELALLITLLIISLIMLFLQCRKK